MKPLIVVCTDFSPCSDLALERAADISRRDETRVFLVHTFDPKKVKGPAAYAPTERDRRGWDEDAMHRLKQARVRYFGHLPDTDVQYDALPCASPSVEICRIANETKASLIVMRSATESENLAVQSMGEEFAFGMGADASASPSATPPRGTASLSARTPASSLDTKRMSTLATPASHLW